MDWKVFASAFGMLFLLDVVQQGINLILSPYIRHTPLGQGAGLRPPFLILFPYTTYYIRHTSSISATFFHR